MTESPIRNYIVSMKAQIVRIGNSQGIRIPKPFLQQSGISEEVDIEVNGSEIIIRYCGGRGKGGRSLSVEWLPGV